MCLFPIANNNLNSPSYKAGVREFSCGCCPECLHSKASVWALRAHFEALEHTHNCMITLTYDNYARDAKGNKIIDTSGNFLELPPDRSLEVSKRDLQLFIKRLRKWYSTISKEKIKYIATAEYGPHTGRAHYHLLLFGVSFPDLVFLKKSKRGNPIFSSGILTRLWNHGICTVDSTCVNGKTSAYCTKYCVKDNNRDADTFMLFSQQLGLSGMLRAFNGKEYLIEGHHHPIPKIVWQHVYSNLFAGLGVPFSVRYVNRKYDEKGNVTNEAKYLKNMELLHNYQILRNSHFLYINYLNYWREYVACKEAVSPSILQRIYNLPDSKYFSYKIKALRVYSLRKQIGYILDTSVYPAPYSKRISAWNRELDKFWRLNFGRALPLSPCHITATDTKNPLFYNICPFDDSMVNSNLSNLYEINRVNKKYVPHLLTTEIQNDIIDLLE